MLSGLINVGAYMVGGDWAFLLSGTVQLFAFYMLPRVN